MASVIAYSKMAFLPISSMVTLALASGFHHHFLRFQKWFLSKKITIENNKIKVNESIFFMFKSLSLKVLVKEKGY